jgi:hypothetical protein
VSATIGPGDLTLYESPRPRLLRLITGREPEPKGTHVLLDRFGIRSTQRLLVSDPGGNVVVAFWPAELKPQAEYLYRDGRGFALVREALQRGWQVWAAPHLAFFTAPASRRLYMSPDVDPAEYAKRWEGSDARWIGEHSVDDLRSTLWPWLKQRGYATAADDGVLAEFIRLLGRRGAHLRPALRFHRRWGAAEVRATAESELADRIREDVNAVIAAAGEPPIRVG